jgi:uncharacterized protein (TIGR03435 family)
MRRVMRSLLLVCGGLLIAAAQGPTFEVVSLKPSPPPSGRMPAFPKPEGGPGTADPTRISYRNMPMAMLITLAFEVNGADVAGPEWVKTYEMAGNTDKFDIEAKLPADTSQQQFHLMLQNLLAERFALQVHREKKEVPAYALVVAKDGSKLKEAPPLDAGADTGEKVDVRVKGEDGFPVTPPGYSGIFVTVKSGHTRVKFIRYSMEQFAKWTRANSKRPGVDRTGLAGVYSFYLEYGNEIGVRRTPDAGGPELLDQAPEFSVALQKELGLKLTPDKAEIEMLVIDHINRTPSGN